MSERVFLFLDRLGTCILNDRSVNLIEDRYDYQRLSYHTYNIHTVHYITLHFAFHISLFTLHFTIHTYIHTFIHSYIHTYIHTQFVAVAEDCLWNYKYITAIQYSVIALKGKVFTHNILFNVCDDV